jgi:4-amino-4-deoxy-L-arabinose transferase-like glycosyltransferase
MVLAGCPLYVLLAQINTLDMALAFFLSAAIFAFALGRYYLFWAACALAMLSKGLIGIVLPAGAIGLYVLLKWDWSLLKKMRIPSGLLLFLVICAPWFILVSARNEEFAHFFFIQEHFQRFTTKMHGRYQPMWYFLPILALGIAPWLLPFFATLRGILARTRSGEFDAKFFLVLWILVVFVFFSISGSKLPSYILPMFPALALLIGRRIAQARPRRVLVIQGGMAAATGIALALLAGTLTRKISGLDIATASAYSLWLLAAGAALTAGALASMALAWRSRIQASVLSLSLASLACTLIALVGHGVLSPYYSLASQAHDVRQGAPVFAVDFYDHTIPWYLRRTVTMVGYKDELDVAISWEDRNGREPPKFIPDLATFAGAWQAAPQAYAVFSSSRFSELKKQLDLPMEIVSQGPRYTIVRKP